MTYDPQTTSNQSQYETAIEVADSIGPATGVLIRSAIGKVEFAASEEERPNLSVEDRVLGIAHACASTDNLVAEEFLAHFLPDLARSARAAMRPRMRQLLDSQDLVNSIVGDAWPSLFESEFRTRAEFSSFLSRRIGWKASDKDRALLSGKRREDRKNAAGDQANDLAESNCDPAALSIFREELDRLLSAYPRLNPRDRDILTRLYLEQTTEEIAEAHKLSCASALKAISRARMRAKAELGTDH